MPSSLVGFTLASTVSLPAYGLSVTGAYVTLRDTYQVTKAGVPAPLSPLPFNSVSGPYVVSGQYFIFATNNESLTPLVVQRISVASSTWPTDPLGLLYTAVKAEFPSATIQDVVRS